MSTHFINHQRIPVSSFETIPVLDPSDGLVFINNYGAGGGVELPFGGVKSSGFVREKGFEALHGFSVMKTVVVKHG